MGRAFDIADGGGPALPTSARIGGNVTVTDRTNGQTVDPAGFVVNSRSVRKVRGWWAVGRSRWMVCYDVAEPAGGLDVPDAG